MTTPVFMSGSDSNATMAFVLPAKAGGTGEVPKPSDGAVTVRELSAGRFAVLRYQRRAQREEGGGIAGPVAERGWRRSG